MKGYRTFILGAAVALLGTAQALDWAQIVTAENAGVIVAGIGAAIMVLRALTNTAAGKSE